MQTEFFANCRKELELLVERMRKYPSMTTDADRQRAKVLRFTTTRKANNAKA